jgi:drug/metabolite transporter (DMT)-like permease
MRNSSRRTLRQEANGTHIVVFACAASAGAHAGLVPAHLQSEPRLGWAFIVAAVLLGAAGIAIAARPGDRRVTAEAALLLGGVMLAYVASRTTAIPLLDPSREGVDAVGVGTTAVETIGLACALWLMQPMGRRGRAHHLQEVS